MYTDARHDRNYLTGDEEPRYLTVSFLLVLTGEKKKKYLISMSFRKPDGVPDGVSFSKQS